MPTGQAKLLPLQTKTLHLIIAVSSVFLYKKAARKCSLARHESILSLGAFEGDGNCH